MIRIKFINWETEKAKYNLSDYLTSIEGWTSDVILNPK